MSYKSQGCWCRLQPTFESLASIKETWLGCAWFKIMTPIGNLLAVGIAVGFFQSSASTAQTPAPARHSEVELEDTGKAPGDLTERILKLDASTMERLRQKVRQIPIPILVPPPPNHESSRWSRKLVNAASSAKLSVSPLPA